MFVTLDVIGLALRWFRLKWTPI